MNWGKGIILGMVIFMLFILSMCVRMFLLPHDDYDHQYYEKGLNFNHYYNREAQVVKDNARPLIMVIGGGLKITFIQPAKGKIIFTRPSNPAMDKSFSFSDSKGVNIQVPPGFVGAGQWQLEFDWISNHKQYLYHQEIFIK